jgi:hypothetical protein
MRLAQAPSVETCLCRSQFVVVALEITSNKVRLARVFIQRHTRRPARQKEEAVVAHDDALDDGECCQLLRTTRTMAHPYQWLYWSMDVAWCSATQTYRRASNLHIRNQQLSCSWRVIEYPGFLVSGFPGFRVRFSEMPTPIWRVSTPTTALLLRGPLDRRTTGPLMRHICHAQNFIRRKLGRGAVTNCDPVRSRQ